MSGRLVPSETFYDRYRRARYTTWALDVEGRQETLQAGDFNELRVPEKDESLLLAALIPQFQRKFSDSITIVISSGNCYFPQYIDAARVQLIVAGSIRQLIQACKTAAAIVSAINVSSGNTGSDHIHAKQVEDQARVLVVFYRLNCVIETQKALRMFQDIYPAAFTDAQRTRGIDPTAPESSHTVRRVDRPALLLRLSPAEETLMAARDMLRQSMAYSAWISVGVFVRGAESVISSFAKGQSLIDRTIQL